MDRERFYAGLVQTEAGSLDPPVLTKDLLALRGMLDLAVRTARKQDEISRSTAVVLLDAACERAVHMVAVSQAVAQKRDDFAQLVGNVRASLGAAWSPGHLPAIRKLHLARNKQQHEAWGRTGRTWNPGALQPPPGLSRALSLPRMAPAWPGLPGTCDTSPGPTGGFRGSSSSNRTRRAGRSRLKVRPAFPEGLGGVEFFRRPYQRLLLRIALI